MDSFEDLGLRGEILQAIEELGFEKPTPIQEKAIPNLLESDRDIIASAQTGTGKTAAFGLPLVQLADLDNKQTQALVLSPTRELCLQIANDLKNFSKKLPKLGIVAVYGGARIETQIKELRGPAQIVVATPGRARDLLRRKKLRLDNISRIVLDEADEMLTMGFKEELDDILSQTPEEKQSLLFSATMSKEILSITKKYMEDPLLISAARMNKGAENVRHEYYQVQARDRYELLKRIADINPDIYGIIFCRTRRETKEIAAQLMHDGYSADALHGDLSQAQRDTVMNKLRSKQLQLLVATDVAARGLDVNDLTHVINFNLPDNVESYVHRSGRTGRAGKLGTSIAIIHSREGRRIRDIERISNIKFNAMSPPTGKEVCTKQLYALMDKIEKVEVDQDQIAPFLPAIYEKFENLSREDLIQHFVSAEFNRFLAYYKNARPLGSNKKSEGKSRSNQKLKRLFINVGEKNHLDPKKLLTIVNEGLDSSDVYVGKIEIFKKFAFFEMDESRVDDLMQSVKGKVFNGVDLSIEPSQSPKEGRGGRSDRGGKKKRKGGFRERRARAKAMSKGGSSRGRRRQR